MWKMLPLILFCSLTQPTVFVHAGTGEVVILGKHERVQIIEVRRETTTVYRGGHYYQINSNKLFCR